MSAPSTNETAITPLALAARCRKIYGLSFPKLDPHVASTSDILRDLLDKTTGFSAYAKARGYDIDAMTTPAQATLRAEWGRLIAAARTLLEAVVLLEHIEP